MICFCLYGIDLQQLTSWTISYLVVLLPAGFGEIPDLNSGIGYSAVTRDYPGLQWLPISIQQIAKAVQLTWILIEDVKDYQMVQGRKDRQIYNWMTSQFPPFPVYDIEGTAAVLESEKVMLIFSSNQQVAKFYSWRLEIFGSNMKMKLV